MSNKLFGAINKAFALSFLMGSSAVYAGSISPQNIDYVIGSGENISVDLVTNSGEEFWYLKDVNDYYNYKGTLTIKESFLSKLTSGEHTFDVFFNDSSKDTLTITVLGEAGGDPATISPASVRFDIADMVSPSFTLSLNGDTLRGVMLGSDTAIYDADADSLTLDADYLKSLGEGEYIFTLEMASSQALSITLEVIDTTITSVSDFDLNIADAVLSSGAELQSDYIDLGQGLVEWTYSADKAGQYQIDFVYQAPHGDKTNKFYVNGNVETVNTAQSMTDTTYTMTIDLLEGDNKIGVDGRGQWGYIRLRGVNLEEKDIVIVEPSTPTLTPAMRYFYKKSIADINFTLDLDGATIDEISINSTVLDASFYTLVDSTLTLKNNYLNSLNNANYIVNVSFADDVESISAILVIKEDNNDDNLPGNADISVSDSVKGNFRDFLNTVNNVQSDNFIDLDDLESDWNGQNMYGDELYGRALGENVGIIWAGWGPSHYTGANYDYKMAMIDANNIKRVSFIPTYFIDTYEKGVVVGNDELTLEKDSQAEILTELFKRGIRLNYRQHVDPMRFAWNQSFDENGPGAKYWRGLFNDFDPMDDKQNYKAVMDEGLYVVAKAIRDAKAQGYALKEPVRFDLGAELMESSKHFSDSWVALVKYVRAEIADKYSDVADDILLSHNFCHHVQYLMELDRHEDQFRRIISGGEAMEQDKLYEDFNELLFIDDMSETERNDFADYLRALDAVTISQYMPLDTANPFDSIERDNVNIDVTAEDVKESLQMHEQNFIQKVMLGKLGLKFNELPQFHLGEYGMGLRGLYTPNIWNADDWQESEMLTFDAQQKHAKVAIDGLMAYMADDKTIAKSLQIWISGAPYDVLRFYQNDGDGMHIGDKSHGINGCSPYNPFAAESLWDYWGGQAYSGTSTTDHRCEAVDADGDGYSFDVEVAAGSDPYDYNSTPDGDLSEDEETNLSNTDADEHTKNLYLALQSLPDHEDNNVLSGQFGGYSGINSNDLGRYNGQGEFPTDKEGNQYASNEMIKYDDAKMERPVIYACDFGMGWNPYTSGDADSLTAGGIVVDGTEKGPAMNYSCTDDLILKAVQGHVIQISNHLPNPTYSGSDNYKKAVGDAAYKNILKEGTEERKNWLAIMDVVAEGLQELEDAKVSVIYRPLHEMNGDWFWWGADNSGGGSVARQALYKQLYQDMHDYFTDTKGLDNLIWVWSPDASRNNMTGYYPGDNYVDIVGLDAYTASWLTIDGIVSDYDTLTTAFPDKPFALAEVGPKADKSNDSDAGVYGMWTPQSPLDYADLLDRIEKDMPKVAYFAAWNLGYSPNYKVVENGKDTFPNNGPVAFGKENLATLGEFLSSYAGDDEDDETTGGETTGGETTGGETTGGETTGGETTGGETTGGETTGGETTGGETTGGETTGGETTGGDETAGAGTAVTPLSTTELFITDAVISSATVQPVTIEADYIQIENSKVGSSAGWDFNVETTGQYTIVLNVDNVNGDSRVNQAFLDGTVKNFTASGPTTVTFDAQLAAGMHTTGIRVADTNAHWGYVRLLSASVEHLGSLSISAPTSGEELESGQDIAVYFDKQGNGDLIYSVNSGAEITYTGSSPLLIPVSDDGFYRIRLRLEGINLTQSVGVRVGETALASFIETDGSQFMHDGTPWYFNGSNQYYLMFKPEAMAEDFFKRAEKTGMNAVRTWMFCNDESTHDGVCINMKSGDSFILSKVASERTAVEQEIIDRSFEIFDNYVALATEKNMRLVLSLSDEWDYFGQISNYGDYNNVEGRNKFKAFITNLLNHTNQITGLAYKDDPTIMMWELANEPRIKPGFTEWVDDIASHIKSLDSNHLVSIGMESSFNFNGSGDTYEALKNLNENANIDAISAHIYPTWWNMTDAQTLSNFEQLAQLGRELDKPTYIGEFSWPANVKRPDSDPEGAAFEDASIADGLAKRTQLFDDWYATAWNNKDSIGGMLSWQLSGLEWGNGSDDTKWGSGPYGVATGGWSANNDGFQLYCVIDDSEYDITKLGAQGDNVEGSTINLDLHEPVCDIIKQYSIDYRTLFE